MCGSIKVVGIEIHPSHPQGNSILVNIVMLGALGHLNVVPFHREEFKEAIAARLATGQLAINLQAFDAGYGMV